MLFRSTKKIKVTIYREVLKLIENDEEEFMCIGIYHVMEQLYDKEFAAEYDISKKSNRSKWKDFFAHSDKNSMTVVDINDVFIMCPPWFLCNKDGKQKRIEILNELIK